jgi:transcriptional regulator with XRE-family HTH domain
VTVPKGYVDVSALYATLDAQRQADGLSWRQLAHKIGISPSTMTRMANGNRPDIDAFAALVQWLGMPAEQFMIDDEPPERDEPDLVAQMAPLLRARKDLTVKDVEYLEDLIRAAVRHMGKAEG